MVTFPENPTDGLEVVDRQPDGVTVVIWRYNESRNEWSHEKYGPVESYVFTDQVYVRDNVGEGLKADPSELKTQKDVNHYLNDNAGGGGGEYLPLSGGDVTGDIHFDGGGSLGAIDNDTRFLSLHFESGAVRYNGWFSHDEHLVTKKRLADYATKEELAALQAQVDNLSGLLIQARYEQGTGITTRPGQFVCVANDTQQNRFSEGSELRLYESDLDQKAPALTRIIAGDYIHIVESTTGLSCQLHVTYSAGTVIRYDYMIGNLDRISDRVPYEFRISGQA